MAYEIATPIMTGPSSPSGTVSSSGDYGSSFRAYRAFDQDTSFTAFIGDFSDSPPPTSGPWWIEYQFPTAKTVLAMQFGGHGTTTAQNNAAKSFKIQGWNGSGWDDLLSVTDHALVGVGLKSAEIPLTTTGSYTRYRMLTSDWYDGGGTFADAWTAWAIDLLVAKTSYEVPAASFTFTPHAAEYILGSFYEVPAADLGFTPEVHSYTVGPVSLTVPAADLVFTSTAPALTIEPDTSVPSTIIYRMYLTGAADATSDVELPVSSFQSRLRNNKPTYLSIVVPNGEVWADSVATRPNGQIVVKRGARYVDGSEQLVEIVRADLENVSDDGGGRNRTLTLRGHQTTDHGTPKGITLQSVTFRQSTGSGRKFRSELDLNLRPGDTVTYDGESFVSDLITYIVSVDSGEMMEVSESE